MLANFYFTQNIELRFISTWCEFKLSIFIFSSSFIWFVSLQMKFSNGANMRRHKQRHTGVKPYECRVCQKRFFRKDHLAEHFTTHTKTLPYHCPICNRGFQRQIAMRAHFQNEHVGQHDLVKTCPLCSYRAGTMKSLRVHFFNRHGIDLDNPGSGTPSSLLLALEQSNSAHLLPALAAAANASANAFSDSGDSARSTDNVTPPVRILIWNSFHNKHFFIFFKRRCIF